MPDYEELYHIMFNACTDALEAIQRGEFLQAMNTLIKAQIQAENEYIKE